MSWVFRTLLVISAVSFPLFLYVALRIASSVGVLRPATKLRGRRTAILVLLWLFALPISVLVLRLLGGIVRVSPLEALPGWVNALFFYPLWTGLIIVVELAGPFILLDLVALGGRIVPSRLPGIRTSLAYTRLGLAAVAIVYVPIRAAADTALVRDTSEVVRIESLPIELENLRITLVGDVQVDPFTGDGKVSQMHGIVRSHRPDLLFSSGDVVTSGTAFLGEAARAMCGMKGSVASVAVMGDHDYWSAPEAIRDLHVQCGWEFLENRHQVIAYRGRSILVSGLTHIYSERLDDAALDRFLSEAPDADLKILLTHQPAEKVIQLAAAKGYSLFLAGHTHGGQIVLHPFGIALTPSMRETRYYTGVHRVGSMSVVVTNGVGLTLAPIRYHAPAEVTSILVTANR